MLDREIAHEVEVDLRRDIDRVPLDTERGVIDDLQVTRKTVTL